MTKCSGINCPFQCSVMDLSKCTTDDCSYYTPTIDFEQVFREYVKQIVMETIKEKENKK